MRAFRTEAGLTQEGLAAEADVHPTYVGRIERGGNLSLRVILKLADGLGVDPVQLFRSDGRPSR